MANTRQTSLGTVHSQTLEHPLTREQRGVKATIRKTGEWIVRAEAPALDPAPFGILRTTDVNAARTHWARLEREMLAAGFTRKET